MFLGALILDALILGAAVAAAQSFPVPIPNGLGELSPPFTGAPARPDPIRGTERISQNRFMAPNGASEIHDDGSQSDVYTWAGPLGRSPQTFSDYLPPSHDCGSITFDRRGRVISICIGPSGPVLHMFDPHTLATLASFSLPPRTAEDLLLSPNIFQNFSAGGYFYLDAHDQVVTSTTTQHIYVIAEGSGSPGFKLVHDYDLSSVLRPDEEINSQLPDSNGLLWFTTRRDGVVGTLDLATGRIHVIRLGNGAEGEITKSMATDSHGGVYIPTDRQLYRFVAGSPNGAGAARGRPAGVPRISWQIAYPNDGVAKPGQLDAGTGTTPVISGGYVGINDNADPMDVMIYRTAVGLTRVVRVHGHRRRVKLARTVCRVPVFHRGASADENAMIAAGRTYVIENNFGYQTPASVAAGHVTAPGFARVDIDRSGLGCHLTWTNQTVSAPTVVSKLSLASGLIYTYTTDASAANPWYWTAIDFRTGRTVFRQLAGTGFDYNNNYAGISISPSGTAYLGVLGGIVAIRDR